MKRWTLKGIAGLLVLLGATSPAFAEHFSDTSRNHHKTRTAQRSVSKIKRAQRKVNQAKRKVIAARRALSQVPCCSCHPYVRIKAQRRLQTAQRRLREAKRQLAEIRHRLGSRETPCTAVNTKPIKRTRRYPTPRRNRTSRVVFEPSWGIGFTRGYRNR